LSPLSSKTALPGPDCECLYETVISKPLIGLTRHHEISRGFAFLESRICSVTKIASEERENRRGIIACYFKEGDELTQQRVRSNVGQPSGFEDQAGVLLHKRSYCHTGSGKFLSARKGVGV
jgi:hypothetical protein